MTQIVERHDKLEGVTSGKPGYSKDERAELLDTAHALLKIAEKKLIAEKIVQQKALTLSTQIVEFIEYCDSGQVQKDNKG